MDDIRGERPASETERELKDAPADAPPSTPRHRRVGPESEVRGGPEAPDPD
jgi:hypothetical protein